MKLAIKSNMEIDPKENKVIISLSPKIFPLEVIYPAAYVFLDRAYIIIDGEPNEEIIVELIPKEKGVDPEVLGREFNNELINYSAYKVQSEKNAAIRQMVVQRALFTNDSELEAAFGTQTGGSYTEDSEGIAIPWEEKFGEIKNEKSKRK